MNFYAVSPECHAVFMDGPVVVLQLRLASISFWLR